jgi:hypothetical protein
MQAFPLILGISDTEKAKGETSFFTEIYKEKNTVKLDIRGHQKP